MTEQLTGKVKDDQGEIAFWTLIPNEKVEVTDQFGKYTYDAQDITHPDAVVMLIDYELMTVAEYTNQKGEWVQYR